MNIYQGSGWNLSINEAWHHEESDGVITISNPEGYGALQVSSYLKDSPVVVNDLKDLASEHIEAGAKVTFSEINGNQSLTLAFGKDGNFWQEWYVAIGNRALYITYNCSELDIEHEIGIVKTMVASLKAT